MFWVKVNKALMHLKTFYEQTVRRDTLHMSQSQVCCPGQLHRRASAPRGGCWKGVKPESTLRRKQTPKTATCAPNQNHRHRTRLSLRGYERCANPKSNETHDAATSLTLRYTDAWGHHARHPCPSPHPSPTRVQPQRGSPPFPTAAAQPLVFPERGRILRGTPP